jgi:hypothetical protein
MSKQVRLRRGTTADHATFTGADGEVTFDTDKKCLVVHDGATPGGHAVTNFLSLTGDQTVGGMIEFGGGTGGYGGVPGIIVDNTASLGFLEVLGIAKFFGIERAVNFLAYAATLNLAFDVYSLYQTTLAGNLTLTTSGLRYGREVSLVVMAGASSRNFTLPAWTFVGSAAPASIAANKTALFRLLSVGTTDASVIAQYFVQP